MKYTQLKKIILFISLVSFVFIGCTQQGAKEPKKKGEVKNLVSDVENVSIIGIGEYKIHTFYGVSNSHVIETPEKLIMIDAQFDFNLAKELKKYVATLNKPLERIILSHAHPDHWFGYPIFEGTPIITTPGVISHLEDRGQEYIEILKPRMGEIIPDEVVPAKGEIKLGKQNWDGLEVILEEYAEHEAHYSIVIKIPEYGVMIGQDLFYNDMHLVAPDRNRNKNWAKLLESFDKNEARDYKTIFVGHGKNTTPEVFQEDIEYLEELEKILASGATQEETKQKLLQKFPDKGGENFINITTRNLFKNKEAE